MKNILLDWTPDRSLKIPVYKQIVEYISGKVSSGDWAVGKRLPSQREMAAQFRVNRSTVVAAMDELTSFGMIEGDAGGGTQVTSNTWSLLMSSPPDWNKYIQSGPFKANLPTIQTINRLEFDSRYIRLGTGELAPELYPKKIMAEVFHKLPEKVASLGYLGPLGLPELRESLAKRLSQRGIPVTKANILITSGALQALQLISVCMLKAGSTVYTEAPTYLKSLQVFQSAGMDFSGVPMDKNGMMYWTIDKISSGSLLYTIPTHHNPTGIVMSQDRRRELFDFCSANRLPMIEDDAYGDLWFSGKPPDPIKTMDRNGMILYLGTMSKTMAPGLRVGWLVGPESVVERLGDVKMQTDYGASSLSQWAAAELLESGLYDDYTVWLRRELKSRRDNALQGLNEHFPDLADWSVPTGGFYIWLRFKGLVPMDRLFNSALENNILLNPGNVYDFSENHALRLSYAYAAPEDLSSALNILAQIVKTFRS